MVGVVTQSHSIITSTRPQQDQPIPIHQVLILLSGCTCKKITSPVHITYCYFFQWRKKQKKLMNTC